MEYFAIIIGAIFVNNVVLAQFLGICPFLGVSNKVNTSLGMGAAVVFVMAISSIVVYLLQYYVLVPLRIEYMQTIVFILVIAALVQMVEIILKKISPALYQAHHCIENITSDMEKCRYDVVGPICESSDCFGRDVMLNETKRGDLIAIRSAGAYGEAMASQYNCRTLPGYLIE